MTISGDARTAGEILYERDGGVALVTISAPRARNALTRSMNVRMVELCDEISEDHSVGAVLLRGAEGTFCSGTNTAEWGPAAPGSKEEFERLEVVYGMMQRVGSLPVPLVAAVRGAALGAGLNLALAADLRVVSTTARLMSGFSRAGLHPGGGFFVLLARSAGREAAAALGLFDIELSGEKAADRGMAFLAVEDHQVEKVALDQARAAAVDPELARLVTQSFRTQLGPPLIPWPAAVEADRGRQMWSHRLRAGRDGPVD